MNSSRTYKVKTFSSPPKEWWKEAKAARVDCFPWVSDYAYKPQTKAWLGTDGTALFVYMETDEADLRMETKGFGSVYTDSCMEFFVAPSPDLFPKYLNFEFNPLGAIYLSVGTDRYDRKDVKLDNYNELFCVKTEIFESAQGTPQGWNIEYRIPLHFLREFFPSLELKPGLAMRGNFYKCGDLCVRPHYGCWSPIDLPKPDFHCPDFFGTLGIESEK